MSWLVSGVVAAMLGTGVAASDGPPAPPPPPHQITLSPAQSAWVCQRLIPGALARIDGAQGRLDDKDAQTPGSAGWLNSWADRAEQHDYPGIADRLRGWAQHGTDRLGTWRDRITAFRAEHCQ